MMVHGGILDEPSATFGCFGPHEIVGPMKPDSAQYGFGLTQRRSVYPVVWMNFNKYRSDLPPWRRVEELVLANQADGEVKEILLTDYRDHYTMVTGALKTVALKFDNVTTDVDGEAVIIDRSEVRN